MFVYQCQIISDFLYVCQSVHCLNFLLDYGNSEYLQSWMSQLSQIFWIYSWDVCTLVPNNFRFLVPLSVFSLPHFLTENRLSVITPVLHELYFSNFLETFLGCLYNKLRPEVLQVQKHGPNHGPKKETPWTCYLDPRKPVFKISNLQVAWNILSRLGSTCDYNQLQLQRGLAKKYVYQLMAKT